MLAYAMLGTNDLPRAKTFYDAVLGDLGYARTMDFGTSQAYGSKEHPNAPQLAIGTPYDNKPATTGNGAMVALIGKTEAKIQSAHARALSLGAKDEGAPGPRGTGFYAAYFRDLDGNKVCLCKF